MRRGILVLGLVLTALLSSGCFTVRLMQPPPLPPESYGELLGVERRGPGEDLFIYHLESHTGAAEGYYAVQPAAGPEPRPPQVHWLEHGETISREALDPVPVLHPRDRRIRAPGPAGNGSEQPAWRVIRLPDALGREHHGYERWSRAHDAWVRVGSCAMGSRKYRWKRHEAVVLLLLPFTLVLDALTCPVQFFVLIIRGIARNAIHSLPGAIADAATAAVIDAAAHRARRKLR